MTAIEFRVPAMHSRRCLRTISAHVSDVTGVRTVEIDLRARTVRVTGPADPAAVCTAITAAGYPPTHAEHTQETTAMDAPTSTAHHGQPDDRTDTFPTDTTGLPSAAPAPVTRLHDGDSLDLTVTAVSTLVDGDPVRMLAYNGSIPGPVLHVDQGSEITVRVHNHGDLDTTVHWHGLRLDHDSDGVPHQTQPPIPVGGSYNYRLRFPDPGIYWYHPHLREDVTQDMGLYGTIVVEPTEPGYWPPADRWLTVTLDDLLIENGSRAPYRRSGPTHTAMGRFGNVMLTNGETRFTGHATVGEVVRLYLVNTANTRIFNIALAGARMKLIGGDSGRYERETFVDEVLLSPSERAVVDVLFDTPGDVRLEHRTPDRVYDLGLFTVAPGPAGPNASFRTLRTHPELAAERARLQHDLARQPDKVLAMVGRMSTHSMHSTHSMDQASAHDAHPASHDGHPTGTGDGLEWEDLMPGMNRESDDTTMSWQLVDRHTGAVNEAIAWSFTVGDRIKLRLVNEMDSDHPMHHPFHVHGAGRFLVLARDGRPEPNLVWKDTVLVPTGQTVDLLLDVSNPGRWMAHCHIAEHNENGMAFSLDVTVR
jgi:FtsP/CotA-like multicopper oxidase with cupredoxin domain